jgi:hypothetical protein
LAYFISATDLKNALNLSVYAQIFDDNQDGTVGDSDANVLLVLERAHAEVLSYLPAIYETLPNELPSSVPTLLKSAELDYACALALDRRPELNRAMGVEERDSRWARAEKKMERIAKAIQRITDNAPGGADPANVGGHMRSGDPDYPEVPDPVFKAGLGDF